MTIRPLPNTLCNQTEQRHSPYATKVGPLPTTSYTAVIERCPDAGLYVGHVPGFPGAHSQAATLDELQANLTEVISMLVENGPPALASEFVGTHTVIATAPA